ncbi:MAG TPA: hypothetical protein VG406_23060 [Isosphaeraceae bacterium]|nr:hypothetical protein [Isosphaeraceae bacterium]
MSVATPEVRDPPTRPRGWQVGVGELTVWVVGWGLALGFARRAAGLARSGLADFATRLELAAMPLAAWSAWILVVEVVRLARGTVGGPVRSRRAGAIAWRVVAMTLLGLFVAGGRLEVLLQLRQSWSNWRPAAISSWDEARTTAMTLGGLLFLAGLMLGLAPPSPPRASRSRSLPAWASVVVASLAGVAIAAAVTAPIPYLVLAALEGVGNALRARDRFEPGRWSPVPGLWERLAGVAPASALGVGACLALAFLISKDARRADRPIGSMRALATRLAALGAAAGTAAYLGLVSIRTLNRHFATGIAEVAGLQEVRFLVLGIAAFAAGLAARAVAPRPEAGPPGPWDRLSKVAGRVALIVLFLASGLLVAIHELTRDHVLHALFGPEPHMTRGGHWLLRAGDFVESLAPETAISVMALGWLSFHVFVRSWAASARSWRPAAFDRMTESRATFGRFAWLATAITVLFLAALPTLFVAGLVAFHMALHAAELWSGSA